MIGRLDDKVSYILPVAYGLASKGYRQLILSPLGCLTLHLVIPSSPHPLIQSPYLPISSSQTDPSTPIVLHSALSESPVLH